MSSNITSYGAVATKIRAMYGMRLTGEEYNRLLNMESVQDVAVFLRSHPLWGRALAGEGGEIRRDRLERLLRHHHLSVYIRLLHYLSRRDQAVARYPVLTNEIEQITRYMRFASAGRVADYTYDMPSYFSRRSRIHYDSLSVADTYEAMLAAVRQSDFHTTLRKLSPQDASFPDYLDVELAMRSYYFRSLIDQAGHSGAEAALFAQWAGLQADWHNITTIARVHRNYPQLKSVVARYLLPFRAHLKQSELLAITEAADEQTFLSLLADTYYGRRFRPGETLDIESLETASKRSMLRFCQRRLRGEEPSTFTVVAYTHLLRIEMENLVSVIESVRYRLPAAQAMEKVILD